MPELPEVEVTRRGIAPSVEGATVTGVVVRNPRLRWPVPADLGNRLVGQVVRSTGRRAKYLLLTFDQGTLIIHLGMSGSLRVVEAASAPAPWDHVDIVFGRHCLRLRDPRRFGAVLWHPAGSGPVTTHPLLSHLGVEPLESGFDGALLHARSRGRRSSVKLFLMDAAVAVGIGNIYASESLFRAGINPRTAAGRITRARYDRLAGCVRETLTAALAAGGSTLRDFVGGDGKAGYFQQQYGVYGREGEPCHACGTTVKRIVQGQRSTFFCPGCQH
jgi:formamidopyrimidine-DNA glycosylase